MFRCNLFWSVDGVSGSFLRYQRVLGVPAAGMEGTCRGHEPFLRDRLPGSFFARRDGGSRVGRGLMGSRNGEGGHGNARRNLSGEK